MRRIFDRRSLTARLMMVAALAIGLVLTVSGIALTLLFDQYIQRRLATELEIRWNELAGAVALDDKDRIVLTRDLADPRYGQPYSGTYWQIDRPDGEPLRSRSLWDETLTIPQAGPTPELFESRDFRDGSALYVLSMPLELAGRAGPVRGTVTVAVDHAEIGALSDAFAADVVRSLVVIAVALLIGALLQAKVGLAPLDALRRSIGAIRTGQSSRMGGGFPSEIQPLAEDLDRMLDWRDQAVQKARDRAGALAHGFKTPLTILSLEARKLAERGEAESAALLREQVEIMRRHVDRELARARIRGRDPSGLGGGAATELRPVAEGLVDVMRRMPEAERLAFTVSIQPGLTARIERSDLGEVLGNLIDNARKFARSALTVSAHAENDGVRLEIADDGPGFGAAAPDGRNDDGSGLGLAIVEDVLAAYGSALAVRRIGERTVVSFVLPLVAPAAHPDAEALVSRRRSSASTSDAA